MPSISIPTAVAVGGSVLSAGAGLIGSGMQAGATQDAQDSANETQLEMEARAREDLRPYNETGQNALTVSGDLSGANGRDAAQAAQDVYLKSPGYDFRMSEGLRAIDAGASAKGMLRSGATLKAEETFGQGLAKQDFDTYYNRLFDLSKLGENAAAKTGDQSITTGQGIAGTDVSSGAAMSSIYGKAAAGVGTAANSFAKNSLYDLGTGGSSGSTYVPPAYGGVDPMLTSINPAGGGVY